MQWEIFGGGLEFGVSTEFGRWGIFMHFYAFTAGIRFLWGFNLEIPLGLNKPIQAKHYTHSANVLRNLSSKMECYSPTVPSLFIYRCFHLWLKCNTIRQRTPVRAEQKRNSKHLLPIYFKCELADIWYYLVLFCMTREFTNRVTCNPNPNCGYVVV